MASELSPSAYVVLGMLGLGASSGYEIKQMVELSIRFFWTISQAQIYPALAQLEATELVVGRSEPRGRRPRRVYSLTAAGEEELRSWLRRAEPMPFELRDIGLVKLFFADALDRDDAGALLAAVRQRSAERAATLRAIEPVARVGAEEGDVYPLLALRMGIAFHESMVRMLDEFAGHTLEGR
jgi:PadR family transcriptional regulator AphA